MEIITTLDKLEVNQKATVTDIKLSGAIYNRLLDIGLVRGTVIECVGKSPLGDPSAYIIRGAVMALRCEESAKIIIMVAAGDVT